MEMSPDLNKVMLSYYEAVSNGDTAFMEQILATQADVVIIGTDPNEWWSDPAELTQVLKAQAEAGIKLVSGDLRCHSEGTVGWTSDKASFVLPDGTELAFRFTTVFHREQGDWKMLQAHASIGVPNDEVIQ